MRNNDPSNDNDTIGNADAMRRRSVEVRERATAINERITTLEQQYYALLTRADYLDEAINEIDPR